MIAIALPVRRTLAADVAYLAGGGAMFASAFIRWVARGPGSGLRGHALIDAVVALGGTFPALSIGRLTVVWYLVPSLGALSWIACGLRGPRSNAARILAGIALATCALIAIAFGHLVGFARLGWGPKLALGGALVMAAAAWLPERGASVR